MVYSLLEIDTKEFQQANKYLEQILQDVFDEETERVDRLETLCNVETEAIQKLSKKR